MGVWLPQTNAIARTMAHMPPWNIGVLLLIALGVLAIPYLLRKKELGRLKERDSIGMDELYARY